MKNVLILLFLFIFTSIGATTYYIDPSGNDSNNGSGSSPWKTLAYACSKATASGDIIHVNAGTYTETAQSFLAVGVSIEGLGSSSIIKSHYTASNLNNGLIQLSGGTNTGQHISGIYLDGDNNTGNNAIVISGRNNVTIYNCTLINFSMQGIKFTGSSACTGNSIHDCTITGCSGYDTQSEANVSLQYQTGFLFYNNINNNTTKSTNGDGIRIWDYVYGLQIYNNTLTGPESLIGGYPFVLEAWCESKQLGYGMQIYGNTIIGTIDFSSCVKGTYSYGVDFHNNICGNSSTGSIPTNPASSSKILLEFEETMNDIIIRNNVFRNADRMIYFDSNGTTGSANNVTIYTNIFQNVYYNYQSQPTSSGYSAHGVGILFGGGAFSGAVTNIKIWNNDFIAYTTTPGAAELGVFLPTSNTCSNIYVQNNIFKGFATAPFSAEAVGGGGTLSNLYLQKNVFYGNGNSNNYLTAGLTPTNVTNDAGIIGDPLFISSTDFHLQTGSPAISKGVSISGLTADFAGSTIKNPPSIGAYESASSAPVAVAPVYQSSVVKNATPSVLEMTYDITMNSTIIPATASFSVLVNTVARTVNSVAISGNKVQLTLAIRIFPGDVVRVSYTKPATNPIQTATGGTATNVSNQQVINNCINTAPTAIITSPLTNSSFSASANITITASALDIDGSVTLVEFYNGTTKLGSKSSAPYTFTWNNVTSGNYSLSVTATDNLNAKTISSSISVSVSVAVAVASAASRTNQHPIVKILNPSKGIKFEKLSHVTIDAIASDPDGTVSKVEFYNGSVKLAELTSGPYSYTWKDVMAGSYSITAIATDNLNDTTISSPVEFEIGSTVKYDVNSEIVKLYPNPNNGHFSVEFINPLQNDKSEIVITDLAGRQVYNGPVLKEEKLKQIDLSGSRSGMYVMMIKDKEIMVTKKFIKN